MNFNAIKWTGPLCKYLSSDIDMPFVFVDISFKIFVNYKHSLKYHLFGQKFRENSSCVVLFMLNMKLFSILERNHYLSLIFKNILLLNIYSNKI